MRASALLATILILCVNAGYAQYDSLSFDFDSFRVYWIEHHKDSTAFERNPRFFSEHFTYPQIKFYDVTNDTVPEAIIWWSGDSSGPRINWSYAGLVIFDIRNSTLLFDEVYSNCIQNQAAWVNPETGEAHYLEDASCCRTVTFGEGTFEFSDLETNQENGVKVDYPCPSVIQLEKGRYKFDGKKMTKLK